jgi:hypothetical protein
MFCIPPYCGMFCRMFCCAPYCGCIGFCIRPGITCFLDCIAGGRAPIPVPITSSFFAMLPRSGLQSLHLDSGLAAEG